MGSYSTMANITSPYSAVHADPQGPGDARPTSLQIVKDAGVEGKLGDKVMLVTGCSSGLGIETARALHATGAHVFMTVRNVDKGQKVLEEIKASSSGKGALDLVKMDLESLQSIRDGAAEVLKKSGNKMNVAVFNAGVMATPEGRTKDGFETQFGTNHLAHFLLFQLLKPALLSSSTSDFHSRVVAVSSMGHRAGSVRFDDYNFDKTPYSEWSAYGQSKTANIWMTNHIDRLYGNGTNGKGWIHAVSLNPGGINTGLQKHQDPAMIKSFERWEIKKTMKDTSQGAATSVWGAVAEPWGTRGAAWLEDCQQFGLLKPGASMFEKGHSSWAFDEAGERKLWDLSCKLVGVSKDD